MNQQTICLNCEHPASSKFCPDCGQKTDTHRITFRHFVFHDIIHGVWHFEKGILFTLKESLFRPGQAALDYISGKRIRYYNVFYLILLLIGLGIFIENLYIDAQTKYISYTEPVVQKAEDSALLAFISQYAKFILLLAIPVFSFTSYLLFNKRKFNYIEHVVIFGMMYLGLIVIALLGNLLSFFEFVKPLSFLADFGYYFVGFASLAYLINGFYGAFGKDYKLAHFATRLFLFMILIVVYIRLLGVVLKILFIN